MKRTLTALLFFALLPTCFTWADADTYFYEGYPTIIHFNPIGLQRMWPKFWYLHVDVEDGGFINMDYRQDGDTLIQGRQYVRVVFGYEEKEDLYRNDFLLMSGIRPDGETYPDTIYYRQEGDKVYCLQAEGNDEILILDFGLEVGDEFTDANGETYVVKDTGRQESDKYFETLYFYQPKKLILLSTQTGMEDTWIEGLGSRNWGITPYFLMERSKVFSRLGLQPFHSVVSIAHGGNLYLAPHVNTENYKAEMIDLFGRNGDGNDISVYYEFIGDTLIIQGKEKSEHNDGSPYAECLINGNKVDVMIKLYSNQDVKKECTYVFDIRIPGFKAGIYQVGMPGREYVTLECKGPADDIDVVKTGAAGTDKRTYDLQGRPVPSKPQRGLYIQGGRIKARK